MSHELTDRFRRWFEYEQDAHTKVVRSLESVPADRRTSAEYRKAVSIFAHIVAARRIWLARMGIIPHLAGPLFPDDRTVADVAADWDDIRQKWATHLENLADEQIQQQFEYQSLDAGRFRNRIEEILTQLFGHSWYHRGQIAMLVRAAGGEPAITDFVYWCRERIE